ncbi:MAG: hypothetical protein KJP01_01860, partial [Gramella sp.]|nr:hypothetical protein [Christiangramia sp.]
VDTIQLNDIHLWDYIKNKDIIVGDLEISKPVVEFYDLKKKPEDSTKTEEKKNSGKFENKILIKRVNVSKGSFQIFQKDSSEHRLLAQLSKLTLEQVSINSATLKETVPFEYELILLNVDSLFYNLNELQELSAGDLVIDNNKVTIKEFRIMPKYSKSGHQQAIDVEKDRYELFVDSIHLSHLDWSLQGDSLKIGNPYTSVDGLDLRIYRDKLQPDDNRVKPMYSQMIRDLPVLLQLDSIKISEAYLKYEEKIHEDREPGMMEFSNLNVNISNITNIDLGRKDFPKTIVRFDTDFMKTAPLNANWEFDISDRSDAFSISGQMGRLAAEHMNEFLKPAMNVEAKGEILDMYFNFYGNNTAASGDMRLEYKDFKVEVLQKDGRKKNKVVSALANLIVKNKALNDKANHKDISYTRDQTKSFWNYFWNLIKNGALKAFL